VTRSAPAVSRPSAPTPSYSAPSRPTAPDSGNRGGGSSRRER
jgi:hypothetical protein